MITSYFVMRNKSDTNSLNFYYTFPLAFIILGFPGCIDINPDFTNSF